MNDGNLNISLGIAVAVLVVAAVVVLGGPARAPGALVGEALLILFFKI